METMVVTKSSGGGSAAALVEPGPLKPGRMKTLAKSADVKGFKYWGLGGRMGMLALVSPVSGPPAYLDRLCET